MNLVAKEFMAARNNNDRTLILSWLAGASQELHRAINLNPYDIEQMADSIKFALEMTLEEQRKRMMKMRKIIVSTNI